MTTQADIAVVEQAAAPAVRSRRGTRLAPLDALRGLIIVVMALDHANAFIAHAHPPPEMWSALLWNWATLIMLMVIFVMIRLRQEEMRREIGSLRRLAHA